MRKIILMTAFITALACSAFAYEDIKQTPGASALSSDFKIMTNEAVTKLDDKDLLGAYTDVSVEIEAQKVLHATSGFLPKDFENFKNLLRYRILLINEMKKRKIEIPQVN